MFARTGVAHLFALSGMHLGILFFLLSMIFIRFRWRIAGSVIVAATIWMYVLLVGMPASVVRAAVMLTIYMVATIDGRDRMSANALFVTVALMLLCSPLMIWDVGFQLSVVSLLSIFSFCPSFYHIVGTKALFRHPVLRKLWAMIAMSLAAQIGTAPLSIYYFGRISIYFLLTNIIAIPLVTLLLYCVFMSLVFWWLPLLRVIFLYAMRVISTVLEKVLEVIDSWKGASIENISINFLQLVLMYVAVIVLAAALKKICSRLEERRSRAIRI